jgi:hypothetical protein
MHNAAFYLIINLAVGGTSGWFPDKVGNKPWFDSSLSAFLFPFVSRAEFCFLRLSSASPLSLQP